MSDGLVTGECRMFCAEMSAGDEMLAHSSCCRTTCGSVGLNSVLRSAITIALFPCESTL